MPVKILFARAENPANTAADDGCFILYRQFSFPEFLTSFPPDKKTRNG